MSQLQRCRTCRFWNNYGTIRPSTCGFVDTITRESAEAFEIEAEADDDSGLWVRLITGPEFGCVHHQPKD